MVHLTNLSSIIFENLRTCHENRRCCRKTLEIGETKFVMDWNDIFLGRIDLMIFFAKLDTLIPISMSEISNKFSIELLNSLEWVNQIGKSLLNSVWQFEYQSKSLLFQYKILFLMQKIKGINAAITQMQ